MIKCSFWGWTGRLFLLPLFLAVWITACSNDPYPDAKESDKTDKVIFYTSFSEAPHELDPQVAYSQDDMMFTRHCYEGLLSYEYLGRPTKLTPSLAKEVPVGEVKRDLDDKVIEVRYSFDLREGVNFIDDPCFVGGKGREMTALDFEYAFKRVADSATKCPVFDSLAHITGMREYREKVDKLREELGLKGGKGEKPKVSSKELYRKAGAIAGIEVTGKYSFDMVLDDQYPVMLYWLAMPFISAIPHEAVDYYYKGRLAVGNVPMEFMHHPVGTGTYKFDWSDFKPEARISLVRNEAWWGHGRVAPTTRFPDKPGSPEDEALGFWSKEDAGRKLCQVERIEFYMDKEDLPRFGKFMQGYYDNSYVPQDKVGEVVSADDSLSPAMKKHGISMTKEVGLNIRYIAFNMDDPKVGHNGLSKAVQQKNRKLRQAMNLVMNMTQFLKVFAPQTAVKAQSILPPGATGADPEYQNPFKMYDDDPEKKLNEAEKLMVQAGYAGGIDPATGKPLVLSFTVGSSKPEHRMQYDQYISDWNKLGVDVQLDASDSNKFQDKVNNGNFQITQWGWIADYRDPENFMFLLYGPNAGKNKPNYAAYNNDYYNYLFKEMEAMLDGDSTEILKQDFDTGLKEKVMMTRYEIIREMVTLLDYDCPWSPIQYGIDFMMQHDWVKNLKPHPHGPYCFQYYRIDKEARDKSQKLWNKPVYWPLLVFSVLFVAFLIPAFITLRKERR